ncbi:unnamed protein product [Miscanthus lutarioriparius]|uniref:BPM/SPOP BACK domain-containing protein n=1 Tax=Miscanthus lutarioriparius TaxID=422564 RepID=A0A811M769_9POAL|nr:unnamed protein product [Miscanthus lutarioriparius]
MPVPSTPPHPSEQGGFLSSSPFNRRRPTVAHQVLPQRGTRGEQGLRVCLSLPRPGRCRAGDGAVPAHTRGRDAGSLLRQPQGSVSRPELQHDFASRTGWGYPKFDGRQSLAARIRRGGDRFTIRCDVVVINGFRTEEATPSATIPPSDLHKHLGNLLLSGRGADVVFEVGGETFAAHRALLRYAYTDSLQEMDRDEEGAVLRNLLVAADRYCIQRLKLICEDKLCRLIDVGTVQTTLELAERHHCIRLKEACLRFLGAPGNLRAAMGTRGQ